MYLGQIAFFKFAVCIHKMVAQVGVEPTTTSKVMSLVSHRCSIRAIKQDAINYLCATTAPPTACGRQDWIRTNDTKFPNLKVNCCMHPF